MSKEKKEEVKTLSESIKDINTRSAARANERSISRAATAAARKKRMSSKPTSSGSSVKGLQGLQGLQGLKKTTK
jgi:hypothetical protein